ncbi:HEAT repeat domain-containing protein [Streptomyces liangshanensis]|uniref:HEAT repeat domain-containing protein n=1 Tax=Streptomyces liangshanensis TaxID=2717324 RepID=A0A6G9GRL1_9ACTN|nr:HEAT repeat domain-containing protein [Streptomyces liangshanensis]QIQ00888.1 HEAT repeat domain-containing protein [Streptomyces liangshanensis]
MSASDEVVLDALRRADVGRLAARLDARACPPYTFRRLVGHDDARVRYLGLVLLTERVVADGSSDELALLLPESVAGLPERSPEEMLALAGLYARLGPYLRGRRRPSWRAADHLSVRVRIAWLRAELVNEPGVIRYAPGELLRHALRDVTATDAHRPADLVAELARNEDPLLRAAALRLAREALHAGLLAPATVRGHVLSLAGGGDGDGSEVGDGDGAGRDRGAVVVGALRELAEPWAVLDPVPVVRLTPHLTAEAVAARPGAAEAALTVAARHGHAGLLRQVAGDPDLPPGPRRRAMESLGDLAGRDDIGELTALAARDPLLLGGPLVACLSGLHRRGHFPAATDVPAVIGLALADHSIDAGEVATILFTARQEMLRVVTGVGVGVGVGVGIGVGVGAGVGVGVGDPSWPRRLDLLVALAAQGAGDPGRSVGEAVTRLLPSVVASVSASASASVSAPFLDAIRALRYTPAEDAVIALLPVAPAAVLRALEAIGGERTVAALREGLGLGGGSGGAGPGGEEKAAGAGAADGKAGTIAPYLRSVRDHALELLWHLNDDPTLRAALLARLDPVDLPARIAADLGRPDPAELALLSSHLDPGEPRAALRRLARHGGAGTLPIVSDLLFRVVAELAEAAESGEPVAAESAAAASGAYLWERLAGATPGSTLGQLVVPQDVVDALHALGGRLHGRRKIRPVCLLDAADADEAGHALVATLTLDLLDRPGVTPGEQVILLELLLRAPYSGTRARVHRLLRHGDRHVRKQVIALFARDVVARGEGDGREVGGRDARALSASLIALTAAPDIQTVRQALLALGHARAHWAAGAVAACLDRPNMNVKKTAARVLVRAGAPAAVPKLLFWLGRHDNPGLRDALVEALRAILGEAYGATVVAAAERETDDRARGLLLAGVDGVLTARALPALVGRRSPVAGMLLAMVRSGGVRLVSGVGVGVSFAGVWAEHGLDAPAVVPVPERDLDVAELVAGGWDEVVARRLVGRAELPSVDDLLALRPLLADWLRLAAAAPGVRRRRILTLVSRACPAPWTAGELELWARSLDVLLAGLGEREYEDRGALLAVLDAVAPRLSAVQKLVAAETVRALPTLPGASSLALLRRLGAVLVRADVDRALVAAGRGADPWRAESEVLREAFGGRDALPVAEGAVAEADALERAVWRAGVGVAVRSLGALEEFREWVGLEVGVEAGELLDALIEAFPLAVREVRPVLLDWMTVLRPLDVSDWGVAGAGVSGSARVRVVRADDLDQPRSAALWERLSGMLESDDPERRAAAAGALGRWGEPDAVGAVSAAFLRGRVELPVGGEAAGGLLSPGESVLRAEGVLHDRAARLCARLDPPDLVPLVPLLLDWWEQDPPAVRGAVEQALRRVPVDDLAEALRPRLDGRAWGFLVLLEGRGPLRTPALEATCGLLRAEGRGDLADRLEASFVEGPLRGSDAGERDAEALASLVAGRGDAPWVEGGGSGESGESAELAELVELVRVGASVERVRRGLSRLTEVGAGGLGGFGGAGVEEVLAGLLTHPRPGVRLHAHRASRVLLDRPTYLRLTERLLGDPQPDVVRMAIRVLAFAGWGPAAGALVGLLEHGDSAVRGEAVAGLERLGVGAVRALRYAVGRARPDRRGRYEDALAVVVSSIAGRA